jgi:hypothetical protein
MNIRLRLIIILAVLATAAIFSATQAPAQQIFNSGEVPISVFGETANGNVTTNTTQKTITTTTTTLTPESVAGPTPLPSPSPSPSPNEADASHHQLHKHPGPLGATGDPTVLVKTVHTSHRVVSLQHINHNMGGGGVEVGYYFTRYLGILGDVSFLGGGDYATAATGNLVARYPFEFGAKSSPSGYSKDGYSKDGKETVVETGPTWGIAPYIMAGGGAQWDGQCLGIADFGGGVELRWSKHYGFFVESRFIYHDHNQNYVATTAGVTFTY